MQLKMRGIRSQVLRQSWRSVTNVRHCESRFSGNGVCSMNYHHRRTMTTHVATRIGDVLDLAASSRPLKDAVKYLETTDSKLLRWSYVDVKKHTDALALGLTEMGFVAGDKIAVWLPLGSVEYAVTLLGAAKVGLTVISVDPPADAANCELTVLRSVLSKYQPKAVIVWGDYGVASSEEAGAAGLIATLFPETAKDSSMKAAFTKLTARAQLPSADMPFLHHVIHTGFTNVRGALTLRNLLVYSSLLPSNSNLKASASLLIHAESGKALSEEAILSAAKKHGQELKLSSDQTSKSGRLVMSTGSAADGRLAEGLIAALMHETLFISPAMTSNDQLVAEAVERENALQL